MSYIFIWHAQRCLRESSAFVAFWDMLTVRDPHLHMYHHLHSHSRTRPSLSLSCFAPCALCDVLTVLLESSRLTCDLLCIPFTTCVCSYALHHVCLYICNMPWHLLLQSVLLIYVAIVTPVEVAFIDPVKYDSAVS